MKEKLNCGAHVRPPLLTNFIVCRTMMCFMYDVRWKLALYNLEVNMSGKNRMVWKLREEREGGWKW